MVSRETSPAPGDAILLMRSLLFSIGMVLATAVVGPFVMLSFPLPFPVRYRIAQQWSHFNIWWLRAICKIDYQVSGAEHIPKTPVVIMAKHQSTWETLFLNAFLPPLSWVIKRELLWVPFFGWSMALLYPIAIDRKSSSVAIRQILEQGKAHLDRGIWVLIFPEGTRTAPGQRKRYGLGGSRLAVHSGYPVLPIAHNAGEFWPRRGFIKRPGTIRLCIGPPIPSQGKEVQTLNREVEQWIESTVEQLSPHRYRNSSTTTTPAAP